MPNPRYYVANLNAPFRQMDGYYRREDGELCFWPKLSKHGYVLSVEFQERNVPLFRRLEDWKAYAGWVSFVAFIAIAVISRFDIADQSFFWSMVGCGAAILAAWLAPLALTLKLRRLMQTQPLINHPAPIPFETLEQVHKFSRWKLYGAQFIVLSLIVALVLGSFDLVSDAPPSAAWVLRGLALFLFLFWVWSLLRRQKMLRYPHDVRDHIFPGEEWTDDKTGEIIRSNQPSDARD